MESDVEGPARSNDILFGTARELNKKSGLEPGAHQKKKKWKRTRKIMKIFQPCYGFRFGKRRSPVVLEDDRVEPPEDRLKRMKDHDMDMKLVSLVGKTGRLDDSLYQSRHTNTGRNEETSTKQTIQDTPCVNSAHSAAETGPRDQPLSHRDSPLSANQQTSSMELEVTHMPYLEMPHVDNCKGHEHEFAAISQVRIASGVNHENKVFVEPSSQHLVEDGPLVDDLKGAKKKISGDIRYCLPHQPHDSDTYGSRQTAMSIEPSSANIKTALNSIKYLKSFQYFHRLPSHSLIAMLQENSYCYPRYAELESRRNTLKDCTGPQLKNYQFEELARVGWFFNRRTLVTFCCGMEMPETPNGLPLDVHQGLSPQCDFAQRLVVQPAPPAEQSQVPATHTQQLSESDQASGDEQGFRFSIPVQATDDTGETYEDSFRRSVSWPASDGLHSGNDLGSPESRPSFVTGDSYALAVPDQVSQKTSYFENLVTSTTLLDSEVFHPQLMAPNPAPPSPPLQNTVQRAGTLSMRSNSHNPQATARLLNELVTDSDRPSAGIGQAIDQMFQDGGSARYPQFSYPTVRGWSFEGWPRTHRQTPTMMADAGFFYAGYGDSVLCYTCGIGVRHWLPRDDPWVEHARWRPSCEFMQTAQGQEFIDAARELTRNNRPATYQEVRRNANQRQRHARADGGADTHAAP